MIFNGRLICEWQLIVESTENESVGICHNDIVISGHMEAGEHKSHPQHLETFVYLLENEWHTLPVHLAYYSF